MRVHSLRVTAFGPFGATVQVDLDELSRDGLFLLCGPTGAGKTSLLDAIAFALYGRVPGARGQEKRLRSDHARDSVRTEVVCELTLRGERVRITRRPEQIRPKARGGGTTKDQALLHVQRQHNGSWEPVSIRLDEGGNYLRDQIGLSPEQFWQVVLLPQGEFAQFLRAEPDQRAKLLETLFDAGRFTDVEEWLAEHAREARAALTEAEDTLDRLLHRVEQAARGLTAPIAGYEAPSRPATGDPVHVRTYVAGQLARAQAQLAVAEVDDETSGAAVGATETGSDLARRAVRAADRLVAAGRQRDLLNARADALAGQQTRLAAATKAEPLRSLLDADCVASAQARQAAASLIDARSDLDDLDLGGLCPVLLASPESTASGSAAVAELRRWSRALRDEVARLSDLDSELQTVEADQARLEALSEQQALRQVSLDDLRKISGKLPVALAELEARRDAARVTAAGRRHAASATAMAKARVEAATRLAELTKLTRTAKSDHERCQRAALAAKAEWLALREARLAGIAAELAGDLIDGRACPVCGSADHPAPAVHVGTAVSAADETAAADRHDSLEQSSQLAAARVLELVREAGACRTVTSGATMAALRTDLAATLRADAAARAAAEQVPELISEHAELVAGREQVTAQITALTEAQVEDRAASKELSGRVRANRRRLDRARGQDASLGARRERLTALAGAAEAVEQAWAASLQARAAVASAQTRLADRLRRSDFAGPEDALQALLDEVTRGELAATIREHEDRQTGMSAELGSASAELDAALFELADAPAAELARAPGLPTQAVSDLADRVRDVRAARDAEHRAALLARERAVAAISRARGIRSQLGELQVLIDQALAECDPLRERNARSAALAALVAGGGANVKKMRLRSYVLAARLEQVAAAATARLRQMSSGRYGFVHSDDLRGGNRRSGLSVDILDGHTGTQRPTKTLSGGESFMASLALALGLADVVTAESGGIALDTLFVDEGFGSLDPDALDAVMTVLDELRQGGRVVGIVSHVEELRTRVPMQLQIQTSSHGSTLDQPEPLKDASAVPLAG